MNKSAFHIIFTLAFTVLLASCEPPSSNNRAWVVSTFAGKVDSKTVSGSASGAALTNARFSKPAGLAVDSSGNIYVGDYGNNLIRKITTDSGGTVSVSTIAGRVDAQGNGGFANGASLTSARFNKPYGVAADSSGNIYVADNVNHLIRKITTDSSGNRVVSTLAGKVENNRGVSGFADGEAANAKFKYPTGVAVREVGEGSSKKVYVYVSDIDNHRIRKISTDSSGTVSVSTIAGGVDAQGNGGFANGAPLTSARFNKPIGIAVGSDGNIYVADQKNHRIRKITTDSNGNAVNVSTIAGGVDAQGNGGFADGEGADARFKEPIGIAVDSDGNVYVADHGNNLIRKITSSKDVSTFAGSTIGFANGAAANAKFKQPTGVVLDSKGNVYVADHGNHLIRKVEYKLQ